MDNEVFPGIPQFVSFEIGTNNRQPKNTYTNNQQPNETTAKDSIIKKLSIIIPYLIKRKRSSRPHRKKKKCNE
jgi:hypothetical protein